MREVESENYHGTGAIGEQMGEVDLKLLDHLVALATRLISGLHGVVLWAIRMMFRGNRGNFFELDPTKNINSRQSEGCYY